MKKLIAMTMAAFTATVVFAEPTVTDVVAKQRYPWNGLVDITCKVTGIDGMTNGVGFIVSAIMPDSGVARDVSHFWVMQSGTNSTDIAVHSNGNYQLVWDARTDLGQVHCTNMVVRITLNNARGKVQLWEGGPYWAETNIGAEEPWEYGYCFWWGDTVGYKRENDKWVATDGSSSNFSFGTSNAPTYKVSVGTLKNKGWITADNVLVPEHDVAHVHWGGRWRMPTYQELKDLVDKCDCLQVVTNGVCGLVFRGRNDYASASIFLPYAGNGGGTSLSNVGLNGSYWSSVPCSDSNNAWGLYFNSDGRSTGSNYRYLGQSVRPVQGFAE